MTATTGVAAGVRLLARKVPRTPSMGELWNGLQPTRLFRALCAEAGGRGFRPHTSWPGPALRDARPGAVRYRARLLEWWRGRQPDKGDGSNAVILSGDGPAPRSHRFALAVTDAGDGPGHGSHKTESQRLRGSQAPIGFMGRSRITGRRAAAGPTHLEPDGCLERIGRSAAEYRENPGCEPHDRGQADTTGQHAAHRDLLPLARGSSNGCPRDFWPNPTCDEFDKRRGRSRRPVTCPHRKWSGASAALVPGGRKCL